MKSIKSLLFFIVILIYAQNCYSQEIPTITRYTEDPVKFLEEVRLTFEIANVPKSEIKEYMAKFITAWNNARFNENLKNATYNTFNLMLKKRIRVLPNYQIYLNAIMNFVYSSQSESAFEAWQNCVMNLLYNESVKNFSNFLDVSENLFLDNIFYKTPVYEYKSSSDNYKFEYDKVKGPKIIFPELTITCYNGQRDSTMLYNTKGVYYPNESLFKGKGGKVNWVRSGLLENTVWAEIKEYEIDLKRGGYTSDSALLYNKEYFVKPLIGNLTEKVISEKGQNISYPRFESYDKKLKIQNIVKNVDYTGGIAMRGPDLVGAGEKNSKAELIFKKEGKPFLTSKSMKFRLSKQDNLSAEYASITLRIGDVDSIIHPSVSLKYDIVTNKLTLFRIAKGISKAPFYNSYHQLNMFFEQMDWITTSDTIRMSMLLGNLSEGALFESINFFRVENYDVLKGMDLVTSLISLRDFVKLKNNGKRDFSVDEFARYIKSDPKYFLPSLVYLGGFGFLTYDGENEMLHINNKVSEYLDDYTKKTDYDVILFPSFTSGSKNAELNLRNYDLSVYGVDQISLSDSQYVVAFPAEKKVVVKKNRDFDFKGVIKAGHFTLFGNNFSFDYDKFTMYLKNVDSVRIKARAFEEDLHGERPMMNVTSVLQKLDGTIEIDNPKNKSGIKPYSKYPIFTSSNNSYVYYDKRYIQKGLYTKDKFYFNLDPFVIDSLDNFKTEGIHFPGEFVSAGIFPKIRDSLGIQPDFSLGFVLKTPPEGYPLYGNKANYSNTISLNSKGLGGDGTLNYITSSTKSNNFVFLPDSANATAQSFDITEQKTKPEYPQAHGEEVNINFRPYKDQLRARNAKGQTISAHNKQSEFDGLMTLTPESLTGKGLAKFGSGRLVSKLIKYSSHALDADTANFSLQSDFSLKSALSFVTENVRSHVDFELRKGEFASNGSGSVVRFPVIQYICFMQSFNWDMDSDDIEFGAKAAKEVANQKDINLKSLEFISTHPKQDSLRFEAQAAKFNPRKNIINATQVEYIKTADALVYPDSGKVFVEKNAVMRSFSNAKIAANSITKLHNLYDCNVNIVGRKKYSGSGYYDYIDENKKKQTFYFSNISVDTTIQTVAETDIPESLKFKLNPNFEYKGKVKLQAAKNFLVFDGYTRLTHLCPTLPKTWFYFETEINPEAIYIPVSKDPMGIDNTKIAASIMAGTSDTTQLYASFLSPIKSPSDVRMLTADGFVFYDKASYEYRISNKEKLVEQSLPGNYLSLNTRNYCKVYGEGSINFGNNFGQVNIGAYGNSTYLFREDSSLFNMIMFFDFFFNDNAMEAMEKNFSIFQGLTAVDYSRPVFEKGMREMLGKTEADKLISQLNLYGTYKKLPDELKKTLFLTDVKMAWNKNTNSFRSVGQIGVGNINKSQINKMVDGQIEIIKKRGGDIINIYLALDENVWYYFNYNRGTMLSVSSNDDFNNALKDLKPDKRKKEVKGLPDYYFNLCLPSKKTQFLRKNAEPEEEE